MAILLSPSGTFRGRDPWVFAHNGAFYHIFSLLDGVAIAKAETLEGLKDAEPVRVWTPEEGKPWSQQLWAPELHIVDGKCYIYLACDDGDNYNHRIYALANNSNDPLTPYTLQGQVKDATNKWAIDGTLLHLNDQLYIVWSGWEGDENIAQNLYIAKMSDPCTICSDRVLISAPEEEWERRGADEKHPFINEGPVVLQRNGKTYILYSASGSWCNDYCLGMLTYVGGDPMTAEAWKKSDGPVFQKTDKVKGPGHCSVVSDGETDYLCYHAFDVDCSGKWKSAHAVAQAFTWDGDTPVFGEPEYIPV